MGFLNQSRAIKSAKIDFKSSASRPESLKNVLHISVHFCPRIQKFPTKHQRVSIQLKIERKTLQRIINLIKLSLTIRVTFGTYNWPVSSLQTFSKRPNEFQWMKNYWQISYAILICNYKTLFVLQQSSYGGWVMTRLVWRRKLHFLFWFIFRENENVVEFYVFSREWLL